MNDNLLYDSCPDCDSLEVDYKLNAEEVDGSLVYNVVCRECGAEWTDLM